MTSATELIRSLLDKEQARILSSWRVHDNRLALLQICRATDSLLFGALTDTEAFEFAREGASKAVSLFVDRSCDNQRIPLFPSEHETFQWAHSVLQHCGRLAVCEKFLEYEKAGLGMFRECGRDLEFEITPRYAGIEAMEEQENQWLESSIRNRQEPFQELRSSLRPKINAQMQDLVYVWHEHYIGYQANPRIDAYFDHEGVMAAQEMTGHDVFADDSLFGGLPFGFFRSTVWTLVGWALKHVSFALLLHEKHPDLRLENLLTVTADVDVLVSEIAASLQVTTRDARQALDLLELNLPNKNRLCINGHAPPPLIRAASEQYLKPVAGFLVEPFQFMLRNLREQYLPDWDRAVNERERLFRTELLDLFPQPFLRKFPRGLRLTRRGNTLTDIDTILIDEKNGFVGLFQLKWQDPFGHSMRERAARMKNFQREASSWIDAVSEYLEHSAEEEKKRLFGFSKSSPAPGYCLFVVGRYFAQFSGNQMPDDRAAWAVWPQLMRLAEKHRGSHNPLLHLHNAVKADSPFKREVAFSLPDLELDGRTIKVKQSQS